MVEVVIWLTSALYYRLQILYQARYCESYLVPLYFDYDNKHYYGCIPITPVEVEGA